MSAAAVTVLSPYWTDFRAHVVDLPDAPGPWSKVWSARVPGSPRSRFQRVGEGLALVNAASGIVPVGPEPPGEGRVLAGEQIHAFRAVEGGPVLVDSRGGVYRWTPGADGTERVAQAEPGAEMDVVGLAGGRLLFQRKSGGALHALLDAAGAGWRMELVEPGGSGPIWRRRVTMGSVLPASDSLFVKTIGHRNGVLRLRAADGVTVWSGGADLSGLIAIVAGQLWATTHDNELVAFDVETGRETVRTRVPDMAVPEGVVDERGRFHACNSLRYSLLDLADGGRVLEREPLGVEGARRPAVGYGDNALITRDGRLLLDDHRGGIYVLRLDPFRGGTIIRPQDAGDKDVGLVGFGVAHGRIYGLTRRHELFALAPA